MLTAVSERSIVSHHANISQGSYEPKEQRILDLFRAPDRLSANRDPHLHPVKLSRQQIAKILSMPINCVAGRVNSLMAKGALIEDGTRLDPDTNRPQALLCLPMSQAELYSAV